MKNMSWRFDNGGWADISLGKIVRAALERRWNKEERLVCSRVDLRSRSNNRAEQSQEIFQGHLSYVALLYCRMPAMNIRQRDEWLKGR